MKLAGQVAIVTGGARGLGRAYAHRLAALGANVVVADRDLNGAAEFGETLNAASVPDELIAMGVRSIGVQGDLGQREAAQDLVARALQAFGRIDILVNNAGGAFAPVDRSTASKMPDEDLDAMMDANFRSMMYCSQEVLPALRAQGGGVIVNVTTMATIHPASTAGRFVPYAISKGAVLQYTRFMAAELGPEGIRVNCISPGVMQTARIKQQAEARDMPPEKMARHIPLRRLGEVEDCANVLEFLVTPLSGYVTGQCISVCGGQVMTPS